MKFLSDNISLTQYALERLKKRQDIAEKYNLVLDQILDLSLGDNLFIPPSLIRKMLVKEIQSIDPRESYPIDYYSFIDEISRFLGVETNAIYPGLTHNQLIQRILSIITKPKDTIMLLIPDKEIYFKIANNQKLKIQGIKLTEEFELDLEEMLEQIELTKPKAVIFSSPHYPTANQLDEKDILALANKTDIPIIVDESYVEFGKYSLVNQVDKYTNLTVVRSFSKAWGLGATSCAYLIANPSFVNILKEAYSFEEIPPIHLLLTNYILQTPYRFVELINSFVAERKRVFEHLKMLNGLKVYKSDTNFLFIKYKNNVNELFEQLSSKGIIVRTFEGYPEFKHRDKAFLVTLGDSSVNDRFIVALIELLEALL
ncbi:MAG: aminotransferase class I/II-fold pyridoxal phosphate-dependent enzyme [Asgard group archaeon]|nr:aminotransferase class I/II-fold pyridoxal phosphate-dependent enzyme [Asgard group archaeon]